MRKPARSRALYSTLVLTTLAAAPGAAQHLHTAQKHLSAGQDAVAEKDWVKAQQEFTSALWIDPDLPTAYYGLGQAQLAQQQFAAAAESFGNCKRGLQQLFLRAQRGAVRAEQDRALAVQTLTDYIAYLKVQQTNAFAGSDTANFTAVTQVEKRVSQLLRDHTDASTLIEVPPEVHFSLGSALLKAGRLQEAESSLLETLATVPDFGPAHNNLAVVYFKTGRLSEARAEVKSAEECGFEVHPMLKKDLERAVASGSPPAE